MTAGTSALLVAIGGVTAGIAVATDDEPVVTTVAPVAGPATAVVLPARTTATVAPSAAGPVTVLDVDPVRPDRRTSDAADRTGTRAPRTPATRAPRVAVPVAPAEPPATGPVVTTRTVVETRAVPYRTRLVRDPELPRGTRRVRVPGTPGEETLSFLVTLADGRETGRRLVATEVTREPQHRVVAVGSRRDDRPRRCRPHAGDCRPAERAACPDGLDPEVEENGSLALLDEDPAVPEPDDRDDREPDDRDGREPDDRDGREPDDRDGREPDATPLC